MNSYELHCGDCLEVMPTLAENSIDAIVTDPPAGIAFIFELPICSTGCADALWDDYFYAVEFVGGVSVGFDES